MENGYGHGIYDGVDADEDERFDRELKMPRRMVRTLEYAQRKRRGTIERPILLGDALSEDLGPHAIRARY